MTVSVSQAHNGAMPFKSRFIELKTDKGYIGGVFPEGTTPQDIIDKFIKSDNAVKEETKTKEKKQAPQIGMMRILFQRLKKDQIEAVNESKELPHNAKIRNDALGRPYLSWNLLDVTEGTHKLPAGYELKNDILGFTHIVREGTKSIFMK